MEKPLRFAGAPTANREKFYREMRESIDPQIDTFITVTTGDDARHYAEGLTLDYTDAEWNISTTWNMILDEAERLAGGKPYYVAILNDDALVDPDWFDTLVEAMERDGSAGASGPRAPAKARSIFGGAFIVKGGLGIRLCGLMRHYYSDDEVQKLCQRNGGFSIVRSARAVNRLADQSTRTSAEIQRVNNEDWPKFRELYGWPESPWANTEYAVVISAPSGEEPSHILETLDGREYLVLTDGWELDHLVEAAKKFDRFVFLKESVRIKPGFWECIDSEPGSCWLFARPSCYMGIYDAPTVARMRTKLGPVRNKEESIQTEWAIHGTVKWKTIWPDVNDYNPLRMEGDELVIGNRYIEKLKGTARCGECAGSGKPGVCEHLRRLAEK